jgi:hypothetical protein
MCSITLAFDNHYFQILTLESFLTLPYQVNVKTKSVKFAERPSMEQLRRQLELLINCFGYIFSHDGDLDLQLTVTVVGSFICSHVCVLYYLFSFCVFSGVSLSVRTPAIST